MAEVLGVVGAIAASLQLAEKFAFLCSKLRKAYKVIKYAVQEIEEVKQRTKSMRDLWRLFHRAMENIQTITTFTVDLSAYKKFQDDLERQGNKVIQRISTILNIFGPLLSRRQGVSYFKTGYARFRWFFRNREDIRILYVQMDLLTRCMDVFISLVQLQMFGQECKINGSATIKAYWDTFEKRVNIQMKEIRRAQKDEIFLLRQEMTAAYKQQQSNLRYEMRNILNKQRIEILQQHPRNNSSSDSSPPTSPPGPSPSTPPTPFSPHPNSLNGEPSTVHAYTRERLDFPEQPSDCRSLNGNSAFAYSNNFDPQDEVSYVSSHQQTSPTQREVVPPSEAQVVEHEAQDDDATSEDNGIYAPTALFGPLTARHRPRPAQISTVSLTPSHQTRHRAPSNEARHDQASSRNTSPPPVDNAPKSGRHSHPSDKAPTHKSFSQHHRRRARTRDISNSGSPSRSQTNKCSCNRRIFKSAYARYWRRRVPIQPGALEPGAPTGPYA